MATTMAAATAVFSGGDRHRYHALTLKQPWHPKTATMRPTTALQRIIVARAEKTSGSSSPGPPESSPSDRPSPGTGPNSASKSGSTSNSASTSDSGHLKKSLKDKTVRDRTWGSKAGYVWLAGPVVATSAVVLPALTFSVPELLHTNYWLGLGAVFGLDLLFVLAADAFFMLSDKTGGHQSVTGGAPWVAPWYVSGHPSGLPQTWDYTCYVGVGVAAFSLVISVLLGRLGVALVTLAPYMVLVLVQAAYERLLSGDKLPTYPLAAIVFTLYRFRQLARAMELFAVFDGGLFLVWTVRFLMGLWTFYLASVLTQLPWMYSAWRSA